MMPNDAAPDWREYEIEESGTAGGHCDCCGAATRRVWGFVRRAGEPVGAYFIAWTEGKPEHGAAFDLILGKWGDSATKQDRYSIALEFRLIDGAPQFIVVDAETRAVSGSPLVGAALNRSDVIGTRLSAHVFAVIDAVYMSESGSAVRSWSVRE